MIHYVGGGKWINDIVNVEDDSKTFKDNVIINYYFINILFTSI